jgi:hypothetical protein
MANEHNVICGTAAGGGLPALQRPPLRLRIGGKQPNVFVTFEAVLQTLWRDVPPAFRDLIDVAAYVYSADQAVGRGSREDEKFGAKWRRTFHFAIPVRLPELWNRAAVREALVEAASFLSEDEYHFHFEGFQDPPADPGFLNFGTDRLGGTVEEVMLFSGGLDSLGGAVQRAVTDKRHVLLVQHVSNPKIEPMHRALLALLAAQAKAAPPVHIPVLINKQRGLTRECTQRTRSLLYTALGATVATMLRLDRLSVYENGVVSLNLPPCSQVVGARASRTTHPRALAALQRLYSSLRDGPFRLVNPFQWLTKADVLGLLKDAGCQDLLRATHSCSGTRSASKEHPHCGVCSQCVDRRFAVLAAGLADQDPAAGYRVQLLTGPVPDGLPRTMLAVYTEMASQIARMKADQFFARFGEATRVLRAFGEGEEEVIAQRVFKLYKRHAEQVCRAVDDAIARHGAELRTRTLPASCLLRMVCDTAPEVGSVAPQEAAHPAADNYFRRAGTVWQVRFAGGKEFFLSGSDGAAYLHLLLQSPGTPVPARDLLALVKGGQRVAGVSQAGEPRDAESRARLEARYAELQAEMDAARKAGDRERQAKCREEMNWFLGEIDKGKGFGGRKRSSAQGSERVRKAVLGALNRVLAEIAKEDKELRDHFRPPRLVRGNNPCYTPPPGVSWET